jgi:hypothetical protein
VGPKTLLWLLTLAMLFACAGGPLAAAGATYCLSFKKLGLSPAERLSKFDLRITSGTVVGFPRVPLDWLIAIDNEANWMREIRGNAIHAAADLEEHQFATDFIRVAGIPAALVRSGMPKKMTVAGYVELAHGDAKRVLPISDRNITLTPERRCRQRR